MYLLKNTIYFDVREKNFSLSRSGFGVFRGTPKVVRRLGVKQEYFSRHEVSKRDNFDLHHIVPIHFARNGEEWMLIDNYKNLIYTEREKHKEIKDDHLLLSIKDGVVSFEDIYFRLKNVEAVNNLSVMYKDDLAGEMMSYNKNILKERFGFI